MGVHDGHRDRVRQDFIDKGELSGFSDLHALELLLFYALRRGDTNPLAHRLLEKFGTLHGVFNASLHELMSVKGVGDSTAVLLRLVPQIARRAEISKTHEIRAILSSSDAGNYCMPYFSFEDDEVLLMLCLDAKRRVIKCVEVGRGMANAVESNLRLITETALRCNACCIALAHNHPDGIAAPSRADVETTKLLLTVLEFQNIQFLDHMIVAGDSYCSMREHGVIPGWK